MPVINSVMTVGSRSANNALGTCLSVPVSVKVEEVISSTPNDLVTWHLAISLDAMVQAVEIPAEIPAAEIPSLANVDGDVLMNDCCSAVAEQMAKRKRGCRFL